MNHTKKKQQGAALILVLVIISVLASLIVSLLTMSRHESRVSNYQLKSTEARLAAKAGFQDACSLLNHLTTDNDYILSSVSRVNQSGSNGDGLLARYTYITKLSENGGKHYPLFTGGAIEDITDVSIPELPCGTSGGDDLLEGSPIAPNVNFDIPVDNYIKTYGLSRDEGGSLVAETTSPLVGQIEIEGQPEDKFIQKYSFWIEDMEGYPNLDFVNGGLNDLGEFEYKFTANGTADKRINRNFEIAGSEGTLFFPETEAGQQQYGAPAPGLSPRELFLFPWEFAGSYRHPYFEIEKILSVPDFAASAGGRVSISPSTENRFVQGLVPWYSESLVPFLHDYQNEGEAKFQINRFLKEFEGMNASAKHSAILEMKQWITDNLPEFENRKGGFPEDYVATICANIVDYADEDQYSTYHKTDVRSLTELKSSGRPTQGDVYDQEEDYRGVDSYLPVNEFFYRLEATEVTNRSAKFRLNPYVEFWNPFNFEITVSDLQANCHFVEKYGFKAGLAEYYLDKEGIDAPSTNDPLNGVPSFTVPPNSYKVVNLGDIEWEFVFEFPPGGSEEGAKITFLGTPKYGQALSASGHKDGKFQVQLILNGQVVEQSGRPFDVNSSSAGSLKNQGYHVKRVSGGSSGIQSGDFWLHSYMPASDRVADQNGTFLGDPFMSYYGVGQANVLGSSNGTIGKSSPGSRNQYLHSSGDPLLKTQTSVRNWPDRGFDDETGSRPNNLNFQPDTFTSGADSHPDRAPFRISNQGRYYSISEMGNIHDPVMWTVLPASNANSDGSVKSWVNANTRHNFELFGGVNNKEHPFWFYPKEGDDEFAAIEGPGTVGLTHGGGNTLRIGRKEHPLFDEPGMRASQLLDLFDTGYTGTSFTLADYADYNSSRHFLPPTAATEEDAADPEFLKLYPQFLHSSGNLRRIYGLLNINTVPTLFEIEALLRGPFSMSETIADPDDNTGKEYSGVLETKDSEDEDYSPFDHCLAPEKITEIAEGLMKARPFVSQSHLARVLSELIYRTDAMPLYPSDAILEEPVARVLNMTHFSSRHFRIFSQGEVVAKATNETIARSTWVHEVAMDQHRDPETGAAGRVYCRILSSREL